MTDHKPRSAETRSRMCSLGDMSRWRPAHRAGPMGQAARQSQAAWGRCAACDRRSLAPSRAARAPRAPPRATRHSRHLGASVPRCVGIVCGKPMSRHVGSSPPG